MPVVFELTCFYITQFSDYTAMRWHFLVLKVLIIQPIDLYTLSKQEGRCDVGGGCSLTPVFSPQTESPPSYDAATKKAQWGSSSPPSLATLSISTHHSTQHYTSSLTHTPATPSHIFSDTLIPTPAAHHKTTVLHRCQRSAVGMHFPGHSWWANISSTRL